MTNYNVKTTANGIEVCARNSPATTTAELTFYAGDDPALRTLTIKICDDYARLCRTIDDVRVADLYASKELKQQNDLYRSTAYAVFEAYKADKRSRLLKSTKAHALRITIKETTTWRGSEEQSEVKYNDYND